MTPSTRNNRFFLKIMLWMLGIMLLLGVGYAYISTQIAQRYMQEASQQLYVSLAEFAAIELETALQGNPDTAAVNQLFYRMRKTNPGAELYWLDEAGYILSRDTLDIGLERDKVNLSPIRTFLAHTPKPYITGDDPRDQQAQLPFSVAEIMIENEPAGYVYVVLGSERQANVNDQVFGNYLPRISLISFGLALLAACLIGVLATWYTTRNLRYIADTVQRFKEGDYTARIPENQKGDFVALADTFNEMATKIQTNITDLSALESFRRELIANVSHDLRTPLSIIQGYTETLLMKADQLDPAYQEQYLSTILKSAQKLTRMVEQLFEYSKLESQQVMPHFEAVFLTELVQDSTANYQILARKKNINLQWTATTSLPPVWADVAMIERVFHNLLDNALKFTPAGGSILIRLEQTVPEQVAVHISDTGNGITEAEQQHIFTRYRRGTIQEKQVKGTGLGLAIVRHILQLHQSDISVNSQQGKGSTFSFYLPVYTAASHG